MPDAYMPGLSQAVGRRMHIPEPDEDTGRRWSIGPLQVWWSAYPMRGSGEPLARPLLENWFALPAGTLPLARDARGRPRLHGPLAGHDVGWSHSGQGLLLATAPGVELGTDLERLRPRPNALALAERYFAPAEAQALSAVPEAVREVAFLRLWCAKEAVLKAHGHGISFGLERLAFAPMDTATLDAGPLRLVACDAALGAPDDWSLHQWQPRPEYLAAVAWRTRPGD